MVAFLLMVLHNIPELATGLGGRKKRNFVKNDKIPALCHQSEEVSNFLRVDFKDMQKAVNSKSVVRNLDYSVTELLNGYSQLLLQFDT